MNFHYLILLTLLLILGSCKLFLGISNPKKEQKVKLDAYLKKIDIDTNYNYVFFKPAFDSIKNLPFKPNWPEGFRPIQFKAFNSNGEMVSHYSSCEGSYRKLKIFEAYPPNNAWPIDSTQNFYDDTKMYRNYDGTKVNLNANNGDLNIVVYWGKWMGRHGKKLLLDLKAYKNSHPEYKINIYKVNVAEYFIYE
jgi:hypothetical protein